MDRLADNLQRLTEDDLLHVVQLVHENKSPDSYTKNDVDGMLSLRQRVLHSILTTFSWGISCRSIHSTGQSDKNVMGVFAREIRSLVPLRGCITTISSFIYCSHSCCHIIGTS